MAEKTFRSPGVFEREIDLTETSEGQSGIPAGVAGAATQGPAFVPITVGSFNQFKNIFGDVKKEFAGPYGAASFLENRSALTYVRVLGAGANLTSADVNLTEQQGTVKNAGFRLSGSLESSDFVRDVGAVQFILGIHEASSDEPAGYPIFTDNDSSAGSTAQLVRGMVMLASGARLEIMSSNEYYSSGQTANDSAFIQSYDGSSKEGTFKLVVSSSAGVTFGNSESIPGVRIYTASLDPSNKHYIANVLNTNPEFFGRDQHLLYADFPVSAEVAKIKKDGTNDVVAVASGSLGISGDSPSSQSYRELFGSFNTRYQSAKTTKFISQPYGEKEYDLFHFEAINDGEAGNKKVKVSISNLKRSTNKNNPYGTFSILIRDYYDNDLDPVVLEQYNECSLDPNDDKFILAASSEYFMCYMFIFPNQYQSCQQQQV